MSAHAPPRPPGVLRVAEPCLRPHAGSPDLAAVAALPPDRGVLDATRAESGAPRGSAAGNLAVARAEKLPVPVPVRPSRGRHRRWTHLASTRSPTTGCGPGTPFTAQEMLPLRPTPSASRTGRTMLESVSRRRVQPKRLLDHPPDTLDVPVDDPGPGLPAIPVGDERTDRLTRISDAGVRFDDSHLNSRERRAPPKRRPMRKSSAGNGRA